MFSPRTKIDFLPACCVAHYYMGIPSVYFALVDTTIKVDSLVRDRLARIASERGTSIREVVAELADSVPTDDELAARALAATQYVRDRINPRSIRVRPRSGRCVLGSD